MLVPADPWTGPVLKWRPKKRPQRGPCTEAVSFGCHRSAVAPLRLFKDKWSKDEHERAKFDFSTIYWKPLRTDLETFAAASCGSEQTRQPLKTIRPHHSARVGIGWSTSAWGCIADSSQSPAGSEKCQVRTNLSSSRPLSTHCCALKQAPGPSLWEPSKDGAGPNSGGDTFSALAMPPAPLPGRCHRAMPMPPAAHPWFVRVSRRGAARQNRRRDRPAPTKAHL